MLRTKEQPLGHIVSLILREQGMETTLRQRHLIEAWPEVMGPVIAARTTRLFIKGQTLHVSLTSALLKHDLQMNRSALVQKLNSHVQTIEAQLSGPSSAPAPVITDIRFY